MASHQPRAQKHKARIKLRTPGGMANAIPPGILRFSLPRRESSFDSGHFHGGALARQFSFQVSRRESLACTLSPHLGQKVMRTIVAEDRVTVVRVRSPL